MDKDVTQPLVPLQKLEEISKQNQQFSLLSVQRLHDQLRYSAERNLESLSERGILKSPGDAPQESASNSQAEDRPIEPFKVSYRQAMEIIEERSNGSYDKLGEEPNRVIVSGEWCLTELEGLIIALRYHHLTAGLAPVGIAQSEHIIDRGGVPVPYYGVTPWEAQEYLDHHARDQIDGTSASKGGRAWVEGEWDLAKLEALGAVLRALTGGWDGAPERVVFWATSEDGNRD